MATEAKTTHSKFAEDSTTEREILKAFGTVMLVHQIDLTRELNHMEVIIRSISESNKVEARKHLSAARTTISNLRSRFAALYEEWQTFEAEQAKLNKV